ncbi:hypothetical protein ACEYYB_07870 [Paracoccus sp. p4-l81]|uniref:hypothetical protein n=1 Tax=unclassified Paracoccus (in: a-proteobacteria) TaxID=2688777 RepID=UPI0035B727BA
MTQRPLDHDHGPSTARLKHFTRIEREAQDKAAPEMGKRRGRDDRNTRLTQFLRIERGERA